MSQLFTYFVCSRESIEKWADALASGDEEVQDDVEAGMPLVMTLKNVGDTELNILAQCVSGEDVNVVAAVGEIDLVREMGEEGPWVMEIRRPAIEASAGMPMSDNAVLRRWVKNTAAFNGQEQWCVENLTADALDALRKLTGQAVEQRLPLYVCFFG